MALTIVFLGYFHVNKTYSREFYQNLWAFIWSIKHKCSPASFGGTIVLSLFWPTSSPGYRSRSGKSYYLNVTLVLSNMWITKIVVKILLLLVSFLFVREIPGRSWLLTYISRRVKVKSLGHGISTKSKLVFFPSIFKHNGIHWANISGAGGSSAGKAIAAFISTADGNMVKAHNRHGPLAKSL